MVHQTKSETMNSNFNKFVYVDFVSLGLFQAFVSRDFMQASASFGIGLAFDPFDQKQSWPERKTWKKMVLISHLALTAAMLGLGMGLNDKV